MKKNPLEAARDRIDAMLNEARGEVSAWNRYTTHELYIDLRNNFPADFEVGLESDLFSRLRVILDSAVERAVAHEMEYVDERPTEAEMEDIHKTAAQYIARLVCDMVKKGAEREFKTR